MLKKSRNQSTGTTALPEGHWENWVQPGRTGPPSLWGWTRTGWRLGLLALRRTLLTPPQVDRGERDQDQDQDQQGDQQRYLPLRVDFHMFRDHRRDGELPPGPVQMVLSSADHGQPSPAAGDCPPLASTVTTVPLPSRAL